MRTRLYQNPTAFAVGVCFGKPDTEGTFETEVFFIGGEPSAFLHRGQLHISASVPPSAFAAFDIPSLRGKLEGAKTVSERHVEDALLFRAPEDNRTLHAALAAMPFGAMAHFEYGGGAMNFEAIAANVESLRGVLNEHVERDRERDGRLTKAESLIAGVGHFLKYAAELTPATDTEDF